MSSVNFTSWSAPERKVAFGRLVRSTQHDIVSPLRALKMYSDFASEDLKHDPNKAKSILESLINNVTKTQDKLEGLLKRFFGCLKKGSVITELKSFNPQEITENLRENYNQELSRKGIELKVSSDKEFQSLISFKSDQQQLSRVLDNLMSNAIEEIDINSKTKCIGLKFSYSEYEQVLRIELSNEAAIGQDDLETVFDPQYSTKAGSRNDPEHPSGTGLYSSREICQSLAGDLTVRKDKEQIVFSVLVKNQQDS